MGMTESWAERAVSKWCTYCRKDTHNDNECWCTRAAPECSQHGYAPSRPFSPPVLAGMFATIPDEAPGFHDLKLPDLCRDDEHDMPTHLHIPGGKKYVHYCPTCKHKSVAFGVLVTC